MNHTCTAMEIPLLKHALRHQPTSALSVWLHQRAGAVGGRNKRIMIVALARKLLVGLWKFATTGVVPEGAIISAA